VSPPFYQDDFATIYLGDAREILPLLKATGEEFDIAAVVVPIIKLGIEMAKCSMVKERYCEIAAKRLSQEVLAL
jgi:hypothetical protein